MSRHHIQRGQKSAVPEDTGAGQAAESAESAGALSGVTREPDSAETVSAAAESAAQTQEEPPAVPAPEEHIPEEEKIPEAEHILELEAQLAETRDQLLRKAADFENFRKRMNQEKQNTIDFANQSLLLDIIPIIDDFERAIQSAESSRDFTSLLDGITMIEKRLSGQLESKWNLKRFISAGEPFDPNRHEALMMEKSPDVTEPVVQEDFLKGYLLKDRVIRAAKVKVILPENPTQAAEEGGAR
ncbi:MAG: nucleotide exchange factor GrpE [Treponema sp.]|jgi:molecular chaperone GrpE|nr:nucleotide exchange factor GrpE [Treponema sp.]